jgi:hypothetical protein
MVLLAPVAWPLSFILDKVRPMFKLQIQNANSKCTTWDAPALRLIILPLLLKLLGIYLIWFEEKRQG